MRRGGTTYSRKDKDKSDDVRGKEEIVCFSAGKLGCEDKDHVEAQKSNHGPDSGSKLHIRLESTFEGPFVDLKRISQIES